MVQLYADSKRTLRHGVVEQVGDVFDGRQKGPQVQGGGQGPRWKCACTSVILEMEPSPGCEETELLLRRRMDQTQGSHTLE